MPSLWPKAFRWAGTDGKIRATWTQAGASMTPGSKASEQLKEPIGWLERKKLASASALGPLKSPIRERPFHPGDNPFTGEATNVSEPERSLWESDRESSISNLKCTDFS